MTKTRSAEVDIEHFLAAAAAGMGSPAPALVWTPGRSGRARRRREGYEVLIGREVLGDAAVARFLAAHELGHVVLGHSTRGRSAALAALYLGTLVGVLSLACVAGVMWAGAWDGLSLGAPVGAAIWLAIAPLLLRRTSWPFEHAADVFAARCGAPLTPAVVDWLEHGPKHHGGGWLDTHPSWRARAAHVDSQCPPQDR